MPLTSNLVGGRGHKAHRRQLNLGRAKAGELYYVGAALSRDAEGRILPGAGGLEAAGVAVEPLFPEDFLANAHLDNRQGSDGVFAGGACARCVRYDRAGEYLFESVLGSPTTGAKAFLVDDDTVSAEPGDIVFGEFTRPDRGGWFVDLAKMNQPPGLAAFAPAAFTPPVFATLAADSAAVERSDVLELSATEPGGFNVQAGAQSGALSFFGVAARDAQPGDVFPVWRGGVVPVRVRDGVALASQALLGWEGVGVRPFDPANDLAALGRALEPTAGGAGEIALCEIWWPPSLKL